ncbi:hypothetical protein ECP03052934_4987 [Escherichia coli p0305293.4]|nr:hypothetical protein ECP03052934_4987 [Escherichia coli p0305293.4]
MSSTRRNGGLFFRAIMLANTCTWTYRGESAVIGPASR